MMITQQPQPTADLDAALYFMGVWDVPALMIDDERQVIREDEIVNPEEFYRDCSPEGVFCEWVHDPAEPEVGLPAASYCVRH